MSDRKTYVCKRTRMAVYLLERGFQPYRIAPDKDNPVYSVYLFTATPELYKAVFDYTSGKYKLMKEGKKTCTNTQTKGLL